MERRLEEEMERERKLKRQRIRSHELKDSDRVESERRLGGRLTEKRTSQAISCDDSHRLHFLSIPAGPTTHLLNRSSATLSHTHTHQLAFLFGASQFYFQTLTSVQLL